MLHVPHCRQRSLYLCRVVSIVIYYLDTIHGLPKHIETTLYPRESLQCPDDIIHVDAQYMTAGESRQRIEDIMLSRDTESYPAQLFPTVVHRKSRHPLIVKIYISSEIVTASTEPEGHCVRYVLDNALDKRISVIGDDSPIRRYQLGEFVKGAGDMLYILKIIEMVRIYVQDYLDFRFKVKKAVHIFTGFCNKIFFFAHIHIAVYLRKIASYKNSRLFLCIF